MDAQINKRGGHRARATVLCNALNAELSSDNPDSDVIITNVEELERQRELILELDTLIETEITDPAIQSAEISESSEKIMKINVCVRKAQNYLKQSNQPDNPTRQAPHVPKNVVLPKLTLHKQARRQDFFQGGGKFDIQGGGKTAIFNANIHICT